MKKKKNLRKIGLILIIIGIILLSSKYITNCISDRKEKKEIKKFYEVQKDINKSEETETDKKTKTQDNFIALINIPKIGLEKGLCEKNSKCNTLQKNIQIMEQSDYPDKDKGNFILAAHSGTGRIAYLKNASKLEKNDKIIVIYNGYKYMYKIVNIYEIDKTGNADIHRDKDKTTLTLITCKYKTDKQIIIISELIDKTKYQ